MVGTDTVIGGAGSDTIVLTATSATLNIASDAQIAGVETVSAAGAVAGVTINLSNQSEGFAIIGGNSADTIIGGSGADTITGGGAADSLNGGAGADTFRYTGLSDSQNGAADTISGFTSGTDKIAFTASTGITTIQGTVADGATVNAHSIAWVIGATETIVYANIAGSGKQIGSNPGNGNLIEIHLAGVTALANGDFQTGAAPAGTAGEPINLGLTSSAAEHGALVSVTLTDVPSGWTINGGAQNADGSWTLQTTDPGSLSVTTLTDFAGAAVLNVAVTWTNADGSTDARFITDNVEAYAAGSPIFAWSGNDALTGSSGQDTFVFSQPIGNDIVHSFEVSSDVIDLISYGWQSFADVQALTADDANGNAVITLTDGQTITLDGVHAADLSAANFEFDVTPTTENPGPMTIGDGAMLPLSGIIHNTGEIDLQASGDDTLLQLIQTGITLNGGGQVIMSDDDHNIIAGTAPNVTLDNVDNVISGAGQLGQGDLTLSNEGSIIATGVHALVLDTGSNVIANAGTLEATGAGGLVLGSGVANNGLIWANGGAVMAEGAVTGSGTALISGAGTIEFGAGSTANTSFDVGASGHLILDDVFHFTGTVSGLGANDDIDLKGIGFSAGTTVNFTENQAGTGGTLTVSDGAQTASIVLLGQYDPTGFTEKADMTNGTVISYDPHHIA